MTFLNPIFLWASLAVLVPIIVHLFNFRRPKKVLFSNIAFVKEVKKSVVRRLRLKQWLLLAARILAILALVFLFANPVRKAEGTQLAAGATSVTVVIDNSYSMKAGNDKGNYWTQAQILAKEILRAYSTNDEFQVMALGDLRTGEPFYDAETAVRDLARLKVKQNSATLADLLSFQQEIFRQANHSNHVLYVLSDFQESTLLSDSSLSQYSDPSVRVNLVPLSTRAISNVYLKDHGLSSGILEVEKPAELEVTLVNESKDPSKNLSLRMNVGTESRPVSTEDLTPAEARKVPFPFTPRTPGWQSGYLEIDDYPVEFDNKRYFSFYVPDREKMLVVEGQPAPHLKLVFGGELLTSFDVTFLPYRELSEANFDDYQSILLVGLPEYSTGLQDKLVAHLSEGKSIAIFPGEGMDLNSANTFLQRIKAGSYNAMQETPQGQFADGVDLQHPIFDRVFVNDAKNRKFDAPLVFKHFPFRPANEVVQNTILRLGNGDPVLNETRTEGGLVYAFGFFPSQAWTDFTIKGSGLAIMVQMARLMNQSMQVQQNQDLGNFTAMRIKTREQATITLKGTGDQELIPEQYAQGGYLVLKFDVLDIEEGNYDLIQDGKVLEKVSFNVPDTESKLEAPDKTALREYLDARNLADISVMEATQNSFAEQLDIQKRGVPLWKYFLALAAFFLLAELLITRMKDYA